jgi:hypothetical protein
MRLFFPLAPRVIVLCLAFASLSRAHAAAPEWKDAKGAVFRGEPIEALGPLAMFRTGAISSRFLPMAVMSPEDCVRFHQAIAQRTPRAARWIDARGEATKECVGRLQRADRGALQSFDFAAVPEPELLIVLFAGRRNPDAATPHYLLDNLAPFVNRLQRVYPGRVATLVWATRQSNVNVRSLPNARTWLVVDPEKQFAMDMVARFVPGEGFLMVLMTREGVPLIGGPANSVAEVMKFVDRASDILWDLNPANPRSARDRLHYLRAVRPRQFAEEKADPLLLIDPLKLDALRQRGVTRIDAALEVGANGALTKVELLPESDIPEPLRPVIADALRRNSIFLPAIDRGAAVPGAHRYTLQVPPVDVTLAADAAWVNGEARVDVPIKSWLVLKPIRVPEQVFSTVDRVGPDGVVMLRAVTAGDANKISKASQMNSFNTDWFAATGGPASVHPTAGDKQEIDGEKLVWKRVASDDGLVDFLGGAGYNSHDFCIGYAWTEVEVAGDCDAWLGFGSDDGAKVWVNGELVNDKWVQRTSRLDDDVVPLRLKRGKNAFLVKIQNMHGLWSFTCRLRVRGT